MTKLITIQRCNACPYFNWIVEQYKDMEEPIHKGYCHALNKKLTEKPKHLENKVSKECPLKDL